MYTILIGVILVAAKERKNAGNNGVCTHYLVVKYRIAFDALEIHEHHNEKAANTMEREKKNWNFL